MSPTDRAVIHPENKKFEIKLRGFIRERWTNLLSISSHKRHLWRQPLARLSGGEYYIGGVGELFFPGSRARVIKKSRFFFRLKNFFFTRGRENWMIVWAAAGV